MRRSAVTLPTYRSRANDRTRIDGDLQYQDYWRRSDQSLVGRNVIPRAKLEYQLTRSIFMRLVGEYDLSETDDLRDETRTFYPLIINGERATATREASPWYGCRTYSASNARSSARIRGPITSRKIAKLWKR